MVSFDDLQRHAGSLAADQVFLCLGTTMKRAGSREAFSRVDLDFTLEAARVARALGAEDSFLVSSVGADPSARSFYLRIKGEVESALGVLGVPVTALRAGLVVGRGGSSLQILARLVGRLPVMVIVRC